MTWRKVSMREAVEFMQSRQIKQEINNASHGTFRMAYGIEFEDHTKVVCESEWSGPYSEYTPDIDAEPPQFYIFDSK